MTNTVKSGIFNWKPRLDSDSLTNFVIVVLNRQIECEKGLIMSLWNRASLKIVVDGGANHWYDFLRAGNLSVSEKSYIPDFITGDLDSIYEDVLNHFKSQGTKIIETPDQNETDFTKALRVLAEFWKGRMTKVEAVITIAETCGRFDQIMANINTLFKAKYLMDAPVYLLSSNSITWILWTGQHEIEVWPPEGDKKSNRWCSLIPVGNRCSRVTTSGLKWNLDSQALEFGEMVSTSNAYSPGNSVVKVECSEPLVWSMQLQ